MDSRLTISKIRSCRSRRCANSCAMEAGQSQCSPSTRHGPGPITPPWSRPSTLDSTHHTYAPRTLASYDAIAFLDSCIRELIEAIKAAGIFERTTFLVVSDHGFRRVEKQIWLRNVLNDAHIGPEVQVIPEGGSG